MQMLRRLLVISAASFLLYGCQSVYYSAAESIGYHKREIMVDRIEDVAESQEEGQEQFKSALDQFNSVVTYDGGDLEAIYKKLNNEYEDSVDAAEEISERIAAVADVSDALFDEWAEEIELYSSAKLKRDSQSKLNQTKRDYKKLMAAMRRSESTLQPVLDTLRDQVLYLKHNLNARALASLKGELQSIDSDVKKLIAAMDSSIAEANQFIKQLQQN